jgi:hypothetical protein
MFAFQDLPVPQLIMAEEEIPILRRHLHQYPGLLPFFPTTAISLWAGEKSEPPSAQTTTGYSKNSLVLSKAV